MMGNGEENGQGTPVTLSSVAARAGVSIATASRVLNGSPRVRPKTRDLVLAAARELDYHLDSRARGLALQRTMTIGFVLSNLGDPFFAELFRGAEDAAAVAGYELLVSTTHAGSADGRNVLKLLRERRVDGAVLLDASQQPRDERALVDSGFAVVLVDPLRPSSRLGSIGMDNLHGGRLAADHLISLGHRKLAYLGRPDGEPNRRRFAALVHTAERAGIPISNLRTIVADEALDSAERAAEEFLRLGTDVTGILCYNDVMAVGALRACRRLGCQVPDDIAIVGFDDVLLAQYVDPPLTTVRQPTYEIGHRAVSMVLDLIAGGSPRQILLEGELVVRGSTSPAKGQS